LPPFGASSGRLGWKYRGDFAGFEILFSKKSANDDEILCSGLCLQANGLA
jgi:hypothetical protein